MERLAEWHTMSIGPITSCLVRLRAGERDALDQLFPLIYEEMKVVAKAQLAREAPGHTLGPTALVHEAYVKLTERERLRPEDRQHFFAIATQAMRRILIDHARARRRLKRGAGQDAVPMDDIQAVMSDQHADELVALDDALDRLAAANARAAQVVERRFFGGLTLEETAESLGVSLKTVQRDWLLARAWLRKEIDGELGVAEARSPATPTSASRGAHASSRARDGNTRSEVAADVGEAE